jgi:salicylate hydroxylase
MFFYDGTSASADVVIGCDGIRSKLKEFMIPEEHNQPKYSGMYGYRAVLDMDVLEKAVGNRRARVATTYVAQGAYALTYPIMRTKQANVGLYIMNPTWESETWVRFADKSDMHRDFRSMGPYINAIMNVS